MSEQETADVNREATGREPVPMFSLEDVQQAHFMRAARFRRLTLISLIVLGQAVVLFTDPDRAYFSLTEMLLMGSFYGSQFAFAFLAGMLTVLGPMSFWIRFLLSFAWMALTLFSNSLFLMRPRAEWEELSAVGTTMITIWIVCQAFWLPRLLLRLQLTRIPFDSFQQSNSQYGLASLLKLTFATACFITILKFVLARTDLQYLLEAIVPIGFLAIWTILLSCPLWFSLLLDRPKILLTFLPVFVLTLGSSYLETWAFNLINHSHESGKEILAINVAQSLWVLAFGLLLRSYGYRLKCGQERMASSAEAAQPPSSVVSSSN